MIRTIYPKRDTEFNHDFPIKEINKEINGEEYALTTYLYMSLLIRVLQNL